MDEGGRDRDPTSELPNTSLTSLCCPKPLRQSFPASPPPRDPILHPWEPEPTPAFRRTGTPLPPLSPHHPVLTPALGSPNPANPWLQMVLRARSCPLSSPGRGGNTALLLLLLLSLFQLPFPHLSSPAAVAEIQGWDAPHLPLASSHHFPPWN